MGTLLTFTAKSGAPASRHEYPVAGKVDSRPVVVNNAAMAAFRFGLMNASSRSLCRALRTGWMRARTTLDRAAVTATCGHTRRRPDRLFLADRVRSWQKDADDQEASR